MGQFEYETKTFIQDQGGGQVRDTGFKLPGHPEIDLKDELNTMDNGGWEPISFIPLSSTQTFGVQVVFKRLRKTH